MFQGRLVFIKRSALIILLFALALSALAGCSTSKADVVKSMVASEKGFYSIYVFWDGETTDYSALTKEMVEVINSEEVLKSMKISNMTFVSVNDKTQKYNYKKTFDLKHSPTILILDNEKVVTQTKDPKDIHVFSKGLNK
ncbi:hypothetical protein ACH6EH_01755 [Paenibacillus sp. JSM ZJ436]